MAYLGIVLLVICALFLLGIQYTMVITDIKNNNAATWEIVVGIIPFGPYILMILTGIWHLITKIFGDS